MYFTNILLNKKENSILQEKHTENLFKNFNFLRINFENMDALQAHGLDFRKKDLILN